ncbi:efflux RND transporter permease subunit [Aestuariivirga litoralis]|uniref:efflux RND transporter permease subunit n=1 Tax=Aestuariivirga litoralis TaxID=2650924 RepID=UPI0018C6DBB6|nr:efflux RND transporter permease subunit [Aestuariivirga litoralis]MBG1231939.1 efflux RND transporter permease subunit [Aestuariivirga litoralis]
MFNFSAFSIRNPVPAVLGFIVLFLLGLVSFRSMAIEQFPNIDVPVIAVTVSEAGATPAELESQVTKIIEDSIAGVSGVKHITSTMSDGRSVTAIEFRLEVPTAKALQDTKDAVTKVRSQLPAGVDEPVISSVDVENQAIQTYAVKAPGMTLEQLSWFVDDTVKRGLQGTAGVGRVERYGGVEREIRINLDPLKLRAFGVTAAQVNAQIAATNTDTGAGKSNVGGQEQAIRTLGGARGLENLKATKILLSNGQAVKLSDLGDVVDSAAEQRTFARADGQSVVSFSVFRAKGASSTDTATRVQNKIAEITAASKGAASFTLVDDTVYFIYGNYKAAMEGLIEGAVLAVIVVFVFLRNFRATMISAISLPLSAFPAFWIMYQLGFSLNLVSFLAITLATGILVDDAIVEIENIARHMRMGKTPYRAAMEAADEIGLAVIAISFSIIAIFAPVSFMSGIAGQYFKQFGMTVAIAVFFSLIVARLITPMMAAYLMKPIPHEEHVPGFLMRTYIGLLHILNHTIKIGKFRPNLMSYVTVFGSFAIVALSVFGFGFLPSGFIPKDDSSRFVLSVELPPGATLDQTRVATDTMADIIRDNKEVTQVFVLGGSSPTGTVEARRAAIFVNLRHRDVELTHNLWNPLASLLHLPQFAWHGRILPQSAVEGEILPKLSGIADVQWAKINPRGDREVQFNMLSNDGVALTNAAADLVAELRKNPKLRAPEAQGALNRPEIQITPKTAEASALGITAAQISQAVRVATIGDFDPLLAKFSVDGRQVPIRVQIPESERSSFSQLANLRIPVQGGLTAAPTTVPLSSVAEVKLSEGPASIRRYDRQRQATIGADLPEGVELGDGTKIIEDTALKMNFPKSVKIQAGADAEIQAEVGAGFAQAGGFGVLLMLVILILLLGNFFVPLSIVLSLPLSLGGVVLALLLTHQAFSMPVFIGMLMLIGIVAKNAIMLVDFAVERKKHGMERVEAVIDAGLKRARPIVMTTIAMGAGMLPTALGIGEGGSFRSPMATAVIGGLIVSTFLSLIFVPSYYIVMDDIARLFGWIFGRFVGKTDEPAIQDPALAAVDAKVEHVGTEVDGLAAKIDTLEEKLQKLISKPSGSVTKFKTAAE